MKRRRQPTAASMIQIGLAAVLVVLLVLLVMWYGRGLNSFEPGEATFQYVAGQRVGYSEEASYRNEQGNVTVSTEGGSQDLAPAPILYEKQRKIVTPVNMLIMQPSQGTAVYRVNYFTSITEKAGVISLENGGKSAEAFDGFLYDGKDTYIFLEPVTLNIGALKVNLEPLSYVTVAYKQYVEYFNSADGSHQMIGYESINVTADFQSGCKLDLGTDVIEIDGMEALIYSAVDDLNVFKMK